MLTICLEGSPGVGKTSLVTAIAAASGHKVVRINLSEQTDIMDLLGSDLPVEGLYHNLQMAVAKISPDLTKISWLR